MDAKIIPQHSQVARLFFACRKLIYGIMDIYAGINVIMCIHHHRVQNRSSILPVPWYQVVIIRACCSTHCNSSTTVFPLSTINVISDIRNLGSRT